MKRLNRGGVILMDEKVMDDMIKSKINTADDDIPNIVKDRFNSTLSNLSRNNRKNLRLINYAAGIALICTIGIGIFLYQHSLYSNSSKNFTTGRATNSQPIVTYKNSKLKPLPRPFDYPVKIISSTPILSSKNSFIIESTDINWTGKSMKIYYVPGNENNQDILVYKKTLPSDAKLLGTTVINNGKWSYECQMPIQDTSFNLNSFYIAVQNDEGILSGTLVETLGYDKFEIYPKNPQVGQQNIDYNINGIPSGYKVMFLLYNHSSGKLISRSDFFDVVGGKVSSSFKLSPETLTADKYELQAKVVPSNWDGKDISKVQCIILCFEVK